MLSRSVFLLFACLGLALFVSRPAFAADTHEGKVVEAGKSKLTMTDKDGKNQHTHQVLNGTKITLDGKACKLDDLKAGFPVQVTVEQTSVGMAASKIEAKSK